MKRIVSLVLCLCMLMSMAVLPAYAETYTGSGKGMGANPVVLEVAIEDGAIKAITVVSHEETPGLSDPAFEAVPAAIIEKQSLAVDTVSGATLTSNAILAAVEARKL